MPTPAPAMLDLAARFTAAQDAYFAAYAPVAALNAAVVTAVADALRDTPAHTTHREALAAENAAEAAWRVADTAERAAHKIAHAPYDRAQEEARQTYNAAMLAAKRPKDAREREAAREAARVAHAVTTHKAHAVYCEALTASGYDALRAETRRLYEAWDALTPSRRNAHAVLRDEAEALIAALPYPERDRLSLLTAVFRNLFPAP